MGVGGKALRSTTLAIVFLLYPPDTSPVHANGPQTGWNGGSIVPLESRQVRLLGERVHVKFEGESYPAGQVEVTYWLHNPTEDPVTLDMTFLMSPGPMTPPEFPNPSWKHDYDFGVRAAGVAIPVEWQPAADEWREFTYAAIDSLPIWSLTIAGSDTMKVQFSYRIHPEGGADGWNYGSRFRYLARSAALWAGRLEFAEFDFDVGGLGDDIRGDAWNSECEVVIQPPGWSWNAGRIHWRFEDWEPDQDFSIEADCFETTMMSDFLQPANDPDNAYLNRRGITFPEYTGDQKLYNQSRLLNELRDAFQHQTLGASSRSNYIPFAIAYLLLRRHEIEARHGARFADDVLQRYFDALSWYTINTGYAPEQLNETERANAKLLKGLEQAILADRGLLPQLSRED